MKLRQRLSVGVLLLLCVTQSTNGGNILVWYTEGSHWINMKPVLDTLVDRGHQVTVLVPSTSMFMNASEPSRFSYEPFNVSVSLAVVEEFFEEFLRFSMYEMDHMSYLQIYIKYMDLMRTDLQFSLKFMDGLMKSETIMKKLKEGNYDLFLSDPIYPGSDLLAELLGLPMVLSLRFSLAHNWERMCGQLPAPPSYVPGAMSKLTDKMDFSERVWNFLFYALQDIVIYDVFWKELDRYYTEIKGSHWINMKPVLDTLVDRGHQVTVLVPSTSMFMNASEPSRFSYEPFNVSVSKETIEEFFEEFLRTTIYEMEDMSYVQFSLKFIDLMKVNLQISLKFLDGVIKSETIMKKLKEGRYDLLLADPIYPGSDLVAEILDIPLVISLRLSIAHTWERHCGQLPAPPSFVPGVMSKLTDKMDFSERLRNFLNYALQDMMMDNFIWKEIDKYYTEIKGTPTSACETMGKADIWLIRTYWDFDFPRPFLPNFKFVGGIHCRPAEPLPEDMEEFVQSSGDAGIVVFTLGSFIKNITSERANMIASALAQIPQKVLWRYSGEKPKTLGANTRTYDWIPQNDLLGHNKTRAFVTHGGTNGIYEAIYHGVPMVGIPFFADQPDNMVHMKTKGAALFLELNLMKSDDLRDAIHTVINEKSYKENAMRLSSIHHDRPMSPRDEAVFWIEFTMRNKGAKHLRVQAHELTWYQYHSLDVVAFLFAIDLFLIYLFIKTCSFCLRRCCGRKQKTE
ncbi:UDP glucuronosyltransferase 2 family, polypeptide B3 isoform X2 [Centropristis striata]|uniref:UDP glucuronosyltransferase 2 family, polypeptide B3 isoform X2 n=1 Tax=Centropristis striata TaxID=184440 RepID=UPI0027E0BEB9|nr:UDP glucuronosyltransferase 2 family, polypeptide B3 isoform X2 [Centropristis striata]